MGCQDYTSAQIGRAFACAIAAGLCTILGSAALWMAPIRSSRFVAAALSFSAGVLMFVSLVDIYATKSVTHFTTAMGSSTNADALAYLYATIAFFGGIPLAYALDFVSNYFTPKLLQEEFPLNAEPGADLAACKTQPEGCACVDCELGPGTSSSAADAGPCNVPSNLDKQRTISADSTATSPATPAAGEISNLPKRQLLKVGLLASLVIAFHNLPEGLVTFMAYLDNIQSGITTAIAIAIHNIPEGIIVAIPIYYATGSKRFAILLSSSSALTEPMGALIGLAVACTGSMNDVALGVVFGLVAGIMIFISLKELYPMARQMDPQDTVSTLSLFAGMLIMAASLIAIAFTEPSAEVVEAAGHLAPVPPS